MFQFPGRQSGYKKYTMPAVAGGLLAAAGLSAVFLGPAPTTQSPMTFPQRAAERSKDAVGALPSAGLGRLDRSVSGLYQQSAEPSESAAKEITLDQFIGMLDKRVSKPVAEKVAKEFMQQPQLKQAWQYYKKERGTKAPAKEFVDYITRIPQFRQLMAHVQNDPGFKASYSDAMKNGDIAKVVKAGLSGSQGVTPGKGATAGDNAAIVREWKQKAQTVDGTAGTGGGRGAQTAGLTAATLHGGLGAPGAIGHGMSGGQAISDGMRAGGISTPGGASQGEYNAGQMSKPQTAIPQDAKLSAFLQCLKNMDGSKVEGIKNDLLSGNFGFWDACTEKTAVADCFKAATSNQSTDGGASCKSLGGAGNACVGVGASYADSCAQQCLADSTCKAGIDIGAAQAYCNKTQDKNCDPSMVTSAAATPNNTTDACAADPTSQACLQASLDAAKNNTNAATMGGGGSTGDTGGAGATSNGGNTLTLSVDTLGKVCQLLNQEPPRNQLKDALIRGGELAAGGALLGAALGSVVPVLGTGAGALIGGAVGGAFGLVTGWFGWP